MALFLNLPVTTTADIADAVRAELAVELARLDVAVSTRVAGADPRLDLLDVAVSTREPANDPRLDNLDATVSSRATPDDVTLTGGPSGEVS